MKGNRTRERAKKTLDARQPRTHLRFNILLQAGDAPPLLTARLVEPCSHTVLPVLVEVPVGDDVVVLHAVMIE